MDPNKFKAYEEAKKAGYSESEIDAYLTAKGKDINQYKLTGFKKAAKGVADVLPAVMSGTGAIIGGTVGSIIPVAGTTTGAVAGAAGGYGTGLATKSGIYNLLGLQQEKSQAELAKESVLGPAVAGAGTLAAGTVSNVAGKVLKPATSYISRAAKTPGSVFEKVKALSPEVNLGELAKQKAAGVQSSVVKKQFVKESRKILEDMNIAGSAKMKAVKELSSLNLDAPENSLMALLKRRGVDKMIKRNLFGQPVASGENLARQSYRMALDKVVKQDKTLQAIDRALSAYYGVKDPIMSILGNRFVQGYTIFEAGRALTSKK